MNLNLRRFTGVKLLSAPESLVFISSLMSDMGWGNPQPEIPAGLF